MPNHTKVETNKALIGKVTGMNVKHARKVAQHLESASRKVNNKNAHLSGPKSQVKSKPPRLGR